MNAYPYSLFHLYLHCHWYNHIAAFDLYPLYPPRVHPSNLMATFEHKALPPQANMEDSAAFWRFYGIVTGSIIFSVVFVKCLIWALIFHEEYPESWQKICERWFGSDYDLCRFILVS